MANHNAPDQVVVAGAKASLEWVAAALAKRSFASRMLAVPGVFHTPLMQGAAEAFARALRAFSFARPQVPLFSSVTNRYLAGPEEVPANLAAQLVTPVRYVDLVRQITSEQATVLVEVGPQQALTRLNRKILNWADAASIACDDPKRPAVEQLCCVQALLECCGALEAMEQPAARQRPTSRAAIGPREILALRRHGPATREDAASSQLEAGCTGHSRRDRRTAGRVHCGAAILPHPEETRQQCNGRPRVGYQPTGADLEKFLIKFVVEQTGYPPEVVELDADLEADLGIDSIKKAQLFGELREYFDVTPSENLTLGRFSDVASRARLSARCTPAKDASSADGADRSGSSPSPMRRLLSCRGRKKKRSSTTAAPASRYRSGRRGFGEVPRQLRGRADRLSARGRGARRRFGSRLGHRQHQEGPALRRAARVFRRYAE